MCKELWCEIYDEFINQHDREPSEEEMQDAYADYCAGLIDFIKNRKL